MLSPDTKATIRNVYRALSSAMPGFKPRQGQLQLIAEIAKTLAGEHAPKPRILVAEAATGIGKSLSYLVAAIPYAQANNKKLVISTATVALQEQLVNKDLPFYATYSKLPFHYTLAKGRTRYCCAHKLANSSQAESQLAMWETPPQPEEVKKLQAMHDALQDGSWNGDRDSWPEPVADSLWQQIASERHHCNMSLAAHRQCPFQRARADLLTHDVIVANHSLLMADLDLGGGAILPEPEDTLYIIDEAHHLPDVAREFFAVQLPLRQSALWAERLNQQSSKLLSILTTGRAQELVNRLRQSLTDMIPALRQLMQIIEHSEQQFSADNIWRFPLGEVPEGFRPLFDELKLSSRKANQTLGILLDQATELVRNDASQNARVEPILAEFSPYLERMNMLERCWTAMNKEEHTSAAPFARWLARDTENHDILVAASPLEIGGKLDGLLWSRCAGAVLCSATLRALGKFDYFCRQAGLGNAHDVVHLALASPFDYPNRSQLLIPNITTDPADENFTKMLIETLPDYLNGQSASLILFASYWQMNQVAAGLRDKGLSLLVQGEASRDALLTLHKMQCDGGKPSILLGTGSFSEGLDLPGHYLTNLIITKLPFAVPTSPLEQAYAEYITHKGGNPFLQITVPEASRKLVQSVGRLIRTEEDSGRVILLDRRVITRRYGKALLDALPPLKRVVEY
ncbi:ATP-dependent DNA helicase DinG [Plesiomonas shigelloides]|uniref:ATP-dependent DNA helicase DinG n=1 Tax=Plesiomonas shigelloides TaxID=703 RepID=UPI001C05C136|nr:ATP-dependent DNA helicase DinG [Plesiomonas shigelloides]QWK96279.1 ATP-dependent DNA helicase DinG [Plesiomonas shigelloides]